MKKTVIATALAFSLVTGVALAHNGNSPYAANQSGWGYGMMNSKGPGTRGPGFHRGQMKGAFGAGMGSYGLCQPGARAFGPSMMNGPRGMQDPAFLKKRDAFLDSTKVLRKTIHEKMFVYREATRDPKETVASLREKEQELFSLRQELMTERQKIFTDQQTTE